MGKVKRSGRRKAQTPTNKVLKPAKSKCRDCGRVDELPRYEFFKANKPRCVACGGLMEYGGSWHKTR